MIYSLRGKLIHTEPSLVVVECGGVGYRCTVSLTTLQKLPAKGAETMLYTFLSIREDAVDLYGFADIVEQQSFKMLTSVTGVGPKVAMSLLSDLTADRLALAVASADAKTLTKSAGVGMKLAQRIVLELKDQIGGLQLPPAALPFAAALAPEERTNRGEAVSALVVLGYSQSEASLAVASCDASASAEQMIKAALKQLARS